MFLAQFLSPWCLRTVFAVACTRAEGHPTVTWLGTEVGACSRGAVAVLRCLLLPVQNSLGPRCFSVCACLMLYT